MSESPAELAASLRVATMRLARRLRQQGQQFQPGGLTPTQLAALGTVDRSGPLTLGELAGLEKVQPPSMTRVVAALEEMGLVERGSDPADARVVLIGVSPAGAERMQAIRATRDEWIEDRLRSLSPEEVAALTSAVALLQAMADS